MARLRTKTISRRTVEAFKVEKDTMFWDSELAGFGVRVYPSGMKVYIAQTRARGKAAQRVTVGEHGVITPEEARRRAGLILLRIKAGQEPVPEPLAATLASGPTVSDLARHYLEDHVAVRCKAKTEENWRRERLRSYSRVLAGSRRGRPTARSLASLARPATRSFARQGSHWLRPGAGGTLPHFGQSPRSTRSAVRR